MAGRLVVRTLISLIGVCAFFGIGLVWVQSECESNASRVRPAAGKVSKSGTVERPSWMVLADCSAYDINCLTAKNVRYAAYPLRTVPNMTSISHLPRRQNLTQIGNTFYTRILEKYESAKITAWRRSTFANAGAIQAAYRLSSQAGDRAALRLRTMTKSVEVQLDDIVKTSFAAWTMSNKAYAQEMLSNVMDMAFRVAEYEFIFILCLDIETYRACNAQGYECIHGYAPSSTTLKTQVQNTKFTVSKWLVDHNIHFVFFEMDIWFIASALDLRPRSDLLVAAHQNNPEAMNIGFFAVKANNATRNFFHDCILEAGMKPDFEDQKIFEAMSLWHRICRTQEQAPRIWKYKPNTTCPQYPLHYEFIPPHTGICSTHPIPTTDTIFIHTLGNVPLQSANGKMMHAKELGIWHDAHDYAADSNKYLALDGFVNNAITLSEKEGYHQRFWLWLQLSVLITIAKASRRILILPRVIADFYYFFPWTFLDLASLRDLCDFRESNFISNRKFWYNQSAPFSSVARLSLRNEAVGFAFDRRQNSSSWYKIPRHPTAQWNHYAAAIDTVKDYQLLLVHPGFISAGLATKLFSGCARDRRKCPNVHPGLMHVVQKVRFCDRGMYVDLARHVSNSFQDTDCFGLGKARVQWREDSS